MATKKKSIAPKKKSRNDSIIVSIIAETMLIDEDQVTPETRFYEDLEMDSIDFLDIVMAIEEKFGIEIDDDDAAKCLRVSDLEQLVDRRAGVAA